MNIKLIIVLVVIIVLIILATKYCIEDSKKEINLDLNSIKDKNKENN